MKIEGYFDHGSFVGTLPRLRLGESTLKIIRRGIRARLNGTTLIVYTDSEPVFIPIVINKIETIQVSAPTNVQITGSGTDAKLHWDCEDSDNWAGSVAIKHPGEDDFNCSAQAFYNSTQLNWLNLALGDNEIKITAQGKGNILEGNTYKIYQPGITIYTITVHREQKVATSSNFRIEMIHDNLSLTWDRDSITNGNSISNNYTHIEVKRFGEEDFRGAGISGVLFSIGLGDWLSVGENIVRVAIATGNVSIVNGVVTRYTPSDWGYIVLIKDTNGNVSIKE